MEIEVTWKRSLQVWLRYVLGRLALTLLFGLPLYGLMKIMSIPKEGLVDRFGFVAVVLGLGASFIISMLPIKWLFNTEFPGFRLALVATTKANGTIDEEMKES